MRRTIQRLIVLPMLAAVLVAPAPPAGSAVGIDDEVGLFDAGSGRWHLRYPDGRISSFYFGGPGDRPLLGDWDCDGIDTVAIYRQSTGFVYLRNRNGFGPAARQIFIGTGGDEVVAGDWDGDGCDTLGIFRSGRVFLNNQLDGSFSDRDFYFGGPGDRPFAGDFNGDGRDSVGVFRPSTHWTFFTESLTGLPRSGGAAAADQSFWTAGADAVALAGDWDGDGDDTLGVFRAGAAAFRLENTNGQSQPDEIYTFGEPGWVPVTGNLGVSPPLPGLALRTIADGFTRPVFVTAPPGDRRLFVVEQGGRVLIVEDEVYPYVFLDNVPVGTGGERGLLGMAFHPEYKANGRFYLHYTDTAGDTRVVEYRTGPNGPAPVRTVLAVDQPATNHNGGMIQFGPDGRLYVALGDGGGGGDPFGNGQNAFTPLGAIVALDVDGTRPDHIWAIGLRNPWRFDWDGDLLYIGDVGQNAWEEIDVVSRFTARRNFGWNVQEGFSCYGAGTCDTSEFIQPVVAYPNPTDGCSVTGGFVYRGWEIDGLHGTYLYSDFCSRFLRGFFYDGTGIVASREWNLAIPANVSSFGEDGFGELYITTFDGLVRKIVAAP